MAVEYHLRIKTPAGVLQAIVDDFRGLSYRREVNTPGLLVFDLDANHAAIAYLEQDAQVEVWRRDSANSIAWYCDFYGLFVDEERFANSDGNSRFRAYCPEQMDLLSRAIVAYPANTADRSSFSAVAAETVLKNLVTYNAGTAGTTGDGRVRNVDAWGGYVSVEADGAGGGTVTYSCAWKPLVEALQDVARIGSLDYSLVQTGARAWEFRTDATLGDDRSGSVTFSLAFGNMANPVLRRNRLQERTVAIVGGQGLDDNRTLVTRTGTNFGGTVNAKEVFVHATQYTTTAGLNAAGDVRLDEIRARDELTFDVIQTPSTLYGSHYFLGDLVTGRYEGVVATKQIWSVNVTLSGENSGSRVETIRVEMQDA